MILREWSVQYCFGSAIFRSAIDIYDDYPVPPEILLETFLDPYHCLADCLDIIVGRNSDQEVYLANAHELAKEIVIEKGFFRQ